MIDRRLVLIFPTLLEQQEKAIVDHLIEFIIYYSKVVAKGNHIDAARVFDYYRRNIMKPTSVEALLNKTGVEVDIIRFIEQYYNQFVWLIGSDKESMIIDRNKDYNRDKYLEVMKHLLEKYRDKKEVSDIIRYLKVHGLSDKNLSDEFIKRIIKKVYEIC